MKYVYFFNFLHKKFVILGRFVCLQIYTKVLQDIRVKWESQYGLACAIDGLRHSRNVWHYRTYLPLEYGRRCTIILYSIVFRKLVQHYRRQYTTVYYLESLVYSTVDITVEYTIVWYLESLGYGTVNSTV